MTEITVRSAKKIVKAALDERDLQYERIRGKTQYFSGLRNPEAIWVYVEGFVAHPLASEVSAIAKENGFFVQFEGRGIVTGT